jgi:SsrA-binding protein
MDLAVAVGKKLYDKRQDMSDRDNKRELERAIKNKGRED